MRKKLVYTCTVVVILLYTIAVNVYIHSVYVYPSNVYSRKCFV